jgi:non-homologous end joining protein Ku
VDADTGEVVSNDDIMKGYKIDTDTYIEVSKDELENIALESTRTIDIDEFVPKNDIDPRYLIRPYYLVPDGKVGHDAFAVIPTRCACDPDEAIGSSGLESSAALSKLVTCTIRKDGYSAHCGAGRARIALGGDKP